MWGLAVLVKMTWHLTIAAGVMAVTAGEVGGFGALWRGCASSEAIQLHLIVLALPLTELWVLPYKGPEAAGSVSVDEASPHLFLVLSMLPPLVLVTQPLLSCEELEAFNVSVLPVELVRPSPTIPELDYVCVHPIVP
jgi:hypothetical protein